MLFTEVFWVEKQLNVKLNAPLLRAIPLTVKKHCDTLLQILKREL